jgi:hypothetical protein
MLYKHRYTEYDFMGYDALWFDTYLSTKVFCVTSQKSSYNIHHYEGLK